jgi:hypothetical protein
VNLAVKHAPIVAEPASLNDSKMSARFCIASSREDLEGDVLVIDGSDFSDYRRNPIVLLEHQTKALVGKSESPDGLSTVEVRPELGKIYATCYYAKTQLGEQTYQLVRDGFMRGASVGFMPLHSKARGTPRGKNGKPPLLISGWRVHEWSNTFLPTNPDAVRETIQRSFSGRPLDPILCKAFEPYAAPPKVWSNGATLEKVMPAEQIQSVTVKADAFPDWLTAKSWLAEKGYTVADAPTSTNESGSRFDFYPAADVKDGTAFDVALDDKAVATFAAGKSVAAGEVIDPAMLDTTTLVPAVPAESVSAARLKAMENELAELKKLVATKAHAPTQDDPGGDPGDVTDAPEPVTEPVIAPHSEEQRLRLKAVQDQLAAAIGQRDELLLTVQKIQARLSRSKR